MAGNFPSIREVFTSEARVKYLLTHSDSGANTLSTDLNFIRGATICTYLLICVLYGLRDNSSIFPWKMVIFGGCFVLLAVGIGNYFFIGLIIPDSLQKSLLYSMHSFSFLAHYFVLMAQALLLLVESIRRSKSSNIRMEIQISFLIFIISLMIIASILRIASSHNDHFFRISTDALNPLP